MCMLRTTLVRRHRVIRRLFIVLPMTTRTIRCCARSRGVRLALVPHVRARSALTSTLWAHFQRVSTPPVQRACVQTSATTHVMCSNHDCDCCHLKMPWIQNWTNEQQVEQTFGVNPSSISCDMGKAYAVQGDTVCNNAKLLTLMGHNVGSLVYPGDDGEGTAASNFVLARYVSPYQSYIAQGWHSAWCGTRFNETPLCQLMFASNPLCSTQHLITVHFRPIP